MARHQRTGTLARSAATFTRSCTRYSQATSGHDETGRRGLRNITDAYRNSKYVEEHVIQGSDALLIDYRTTANGITCDQLQGFFVGWPNPPSPETHLRLLRGSAVVALAQERETGQVVGFATAITDGILSAYIPLLEVLPPYQGRGIGTALMRSVLKQLDGFYMVDLTCDDVTRAFYARLGLRPSRGMALRRHDRQSG